MSVEQSSDSDHAVLLCGAWHSKLLGALHGMLQTGELCDLTVQSQDDDDGLSVSAHAAVLSAASPWFRSMLAGLNQELVLTCAVKTSALRAVVDFVYLGSVEVPVTELQSILEAAEYFGVVELANACFEQLDVRLDNKAKLKIEQLNEGCDEAEDQPVNTATLRNAKDDAGGAETTHTPRRSLRKHTATSKTIRTASKRTKQVAEKGKKLLKEHSKVSKTLGRNECESSEMQSLAIVSQTAKRDRPGNHFCNKCGQRFKSTAELDKHSANHNESDPIQCHLCLLEFMDKDSLLVHRRKHKIFKAKCSHCDTMFDTKASLQTHVLEHHNRKLPCDYCKKILPTEEALTKHRNTHLTGPAGESGRRHSSDFVCCGQIFNDFASYVTHVRQHPNEQPYSCIHCTETFKDDHERKLHQRGHHDVSGGRDNFPECTSRFCRQPYPKVLKKSSCWESRKNSIVCELCGKMFGSKTPHTAHMHRHRGTFMYTCEYCGKGFMDRDSFRSHISGHKGSGPLFKCHICGLQVTTRKGLTKHIRSLHDRTNRFQCTECDTAFRHRSSLVAHSRTHSGTKPYTCEYCGKGFSDSSHMRVHMRYHTGERPYVCSVCGQGFTQSTSLKAHYKTHRPNDTTTSKRRKPATKQQQLQQQQEQQQHMLKNEEVKATDRPLMTYPQPSITDTVYVVQVPNTSFPVLQPQDDDLQYNIMIDDTSGFLVQSAQLQ